MHTCVCIEWLNMLHGNLDLHVGVFFVCVFWMDDFKIIRMTEKTKNKTQGGFWNDARYGNHEREGCDKC